MALLHKVALDLMGKFATCSIRRESGLNFSVDLFFFFFFLAWAIYFSVSLIAKQKCIRLASPETDPAARIQVQVWIRKCSLEKPMGE